MRRPAAAPPGFETMTASNKAEALLPLGAARVIESENEAVLDRETTAELLFVDRVDVWA
ncbi:MAG: hypothetical protein LBJ36_00550 [Synergistaceae bacterium]|nr:hypothetical protein [Synergistaceae bacterium]